MLLSRRNFSASSHRMQPIRSNQTKVRGKEQANSTQHEWLAIKEFSQTQKEGESAAEEAKRGGAEKFCILCARRTNWTSLTLSLCLDLSEEALTAHEQSITLFHVVVAILLSLRQGLGLRGCPLS